MAAIGGFKLVLNSLAGVGDDNASLGFSYDFANQPDGMYELTWSWVSGVNDLDPPKYAELRADFGTVRAYTPTATSNSSKGTLGLLYPIVTSATEAFFSTRVSDNGVTYLRRPQRMDFTISVHDAGGALFLDNNSAILADYILILNFKYIGPV
jgi:hypothetical protein